MTSKNDYETFLKKANKRYKTKQEVIELQKEIKDNPTWSEYREKIVNTIMFSVTQMMGDTIVWYQTLPCVRLYDDEGLSDGDYRKVLCDLHKNRSQGEDTVVIHDYHWIGSKDDDTKVFDPYNNYQIPNTYQLCQTYVMMYLSNNLPKLRKTPKFTDYYYYTKKAIEFAAMVLMSKNINWNIMSPPDLDNWKGRDTPRKMKHTMKKCLQICLKYPNTMVNLILID